jgi:four helix bundle protein
VLQQLRTPKGVVANRVEIIPEFGWNDPCSTVGMGAKTFREVIAWQLAREFRKSVRPFWERAEERRDFDLCNQLREAARSATSNIAEGFPCSHAEYARFLQISTRSLEEIEDRLIEMVDDELITEQEAQPSLHLKMRTSRAIAKLRAYLLATPDPPSYQPSRPKPRSRHRT